MTSPPESLPSFAVAVQLLAKGKTLLAASDFEGAVQATGEALEIATKVKGELDHELAEFYYANGNALLCRYEESTQDQVLPGETLQEVVENVQGNGEAEDTKQTESEQVAATNGDAASSSDEESQPDEVSSDVDELQLAWENLETARIIYLNFPSAEELIKVHVRLGDLEVIKQNYPGAQEEYQKALNLMDPETPSRKLAEIYFLLGSTSLAVPEHEMEAVGYFDKAMGTLEGVKMESRETIEELIKEIKEKREDAVEQAESYKAIKESLKAVAGDVFSAPQNPAGPVVDLGVVKRKREEQPADSGEKRPKLDP